MNHLLIRIFTSLNIKVASHLVEYLVAEVQNFGDSKAGKNSIP